MLQEFKNLKTKLDNLVKIESIDNITALKEMLIVTDDIIENKQKSKYFQYVSPYDVVVEDTSQCRAITIDPDTLHSVQQSILRSKNVTNPVLLVRTNKGKHKYKLLNGGHRHKASKNLLDTDELPENFQYPAVVLEIKQYSELLPAISLIQGSLNDHPPRKSNTENDIGKVISDYIRTNKIDLENKEEYNKAFNIFTNSFAHSNPKTIKRRLTSEKNRIKMERSDVYCASSTVFKNKFIEVFKGTPDLLTIDNKEYNNPNLVFISNRGSTIDQALIRSAMYNYDNPSKQTIYVIACERNKGDGQGTILSRIQCFNKLKKAWLTTDKCEKFIPDLAVVVPQNMSRQTCRINDSLLVARPEKINSQKSWIRITKQEILSHFKTDTEAFKEEWLIRKEDVAKNMMANVANC
jgi:hypothetical protein